MSKDTQESPRDRKKREVRQKLFWGALSIIGVVILFGAFIILCCGSGSKKSDAERTVAQALRMRTGPGAGLKIIEVSQPDSVFFNRMCPEDELMELSEKFLEYSMNIMRESTPEMYEDGKSSYRCTMERYTTTSNAINSMNEMLQKPAGKYCGWRVKAKYQAVDDSGTPYIAETWFFFDKRKKHILNSYDICIL